MVKYTKQNVGKILFQWFPKKNNRFVYSIVIFVLIAAFSVIIVNLQKHQNIALLITGLFGVFLIVLRIVLEKKKGTKYFITENGVFTSYTNDNHEIQEYPKNIFHLGEFVNVRISGKNQVHCIIQLANSQMTMKEMKTSPTTAKTVVLGFESKEEALKAESILRGLLGERPVMNLEEVPYEEAEFSTHEQYLTPPLTGSIGRDFYKIRTECPSCGKRIKPKPWRTIKCSCGNRYYQTLDQIIVGLTWAWPYVAVVCFAAGFIYRASGGTGAGNEVIAGLGGALCGAAIWCLFFYLVMFIYDFSIGVRKIFWWYKLPKK